MKWDDNYFQMKRSTNANKRVIGDETKYLRNKSTIWRQRWRDHPETKRKSSWNATKHNWFNNGHVCHPRGVLYHSYQKNNRWMSPLTASAVKTWQPMTNDSRVTSADKYTRRILLAEEINDPNSVNIIIISSSSSSSWWQRAERHVHH